MALACVCLLGCDRRTRVVGTVRDERGRPLDHALVELRREGAEKTARAETDTSGSFSVTLIDGPWSPDELMVVVTKTGYAPQRQGLTAGGRRQIDFTLTVNTTDR